MKQNIFELLSISPGDAIKVDNPFSSSGPRLVIPLGLSKNEISIRVIDCRYGDVRYVNGNWSILPENHPAFKLKELPYIKGKIKDWHSQKADQSKAEVLFENQIRERELATFDEVLSTISISNLKIVITGKLPIPRDKAEDLIKDKGGIVMSSVSKSTSFLIMGDTGKYQITNKMKKAHDLGVKIITL